MQWLFVFLRGHRAYVVLGVAVLVSFSLMALGRSESVAMARGIATGLMKAGHGLFTWPMELSRLRHENRVLRDQNLRISLELLELREARMENLRLRALLDFRTKAEGIYLVARVVARDPNRILNTVLLDMGAADGVGKRMPVVTADGLVGRVLEVHPHTSVVQLLLDRNCRVSAIVQRDKRTLGHRDVRKRQLFSETCVGTQRGVRGRQGDLLRFGRCFSQGSSNRYGLTRG